MGTFAEYYSDLLRWETGETQELITSWDEELITRLLQEFSNAIEDSRIIGLNFPIRENSSNQSIGNQIADFVAGRLNRELQNFTFDKCRGNGYPDFVLVEGNVRQIALEVKATSQWNANDSNRRVLTSSSRKLRSNFVSPIYHLLCTIIYQQISRVEGRVESIRLDFMQPTTQVNIRLESSTSHRYLEIGDHRSVKF